VDDSEACQGQERLGSASETTSSINGKWWLFDPSG
jgi:hypothetical protein